MILTLLIGDCIKQTISAFSFADITSSMKLFTYKTPALQQFCHVVKVIVAYASRLHIEQILKYEGKSDNKVLYFIATK
jgi:hypothetical protein